MADHTVFLIHGMGEHAERTWANPVIEKFTAMSSKYQSFKDKPLSERVEFVPISYDDIIVGALQQWKQNSERLTEFARVNGLQDSALVPVIQAMAEQDEPFFWSHVADVIVYRLLEGYRYLIRLRVIRQIGEAIIQRIESGRVPNCSVVAHSLGAGVAAEALHFLGTEPWGGKENPFGPRHWRFHHIIMLANSSRLLKNDIDPYKSIVRPGPNIDENSYCYQYHSYDHEYDPVGGLLPLSPSDWQVSGPKSPICHFRDWNYHAFEHYLDNPLVHIPLLRAFTNKWTISRDEERSAIKQYETFGGRFEKVREQAEGILGKIQLIRKSHFVRLDLTNIPSIDLHIL